MEPPWPGEGAGYGVGQGKLPALLSGKEALLCPADPRTPSSTSSMGFSHRMDGVQVGFVPGGPQGRDDFLEDGAG